MCVSVMYLNVPANFSNYVFFFPFNFQKRRKEICLIINIISILICGNPKDPG